MVVDVNRTRIEVTSGDIVDAGTEALVNAANNHFWMGSGVAGALKRAGGSVIEQEAVAQGPKPVGESVVTSAGRLPARYVIHAAVMGQDLATDPELVARATRSALEAASSRGVESVAFPAFGTGVGGLDPSRSADAMVGSVVEFLRATDTPIRRITFVLFSPPLERAFRSALERSVSLKG